MMVPIDPYKTLYRPKLFTNAEKTMEASMLKKVARMAPGELSFHLFCTAGAYLKIKCCKYLEKSARSEEIMLQIKIKIKSARFKFAEGVAQANFFLKSSAFLPFLALFLFK